MDGWAGLLERVGLPVALLAVVGYVGFTALLEPMAQAYIESIADVARTAEKLEQAVEDNQTEDGERVKEITVALKALENKIDQALQRMGQ